MNKYYGLVVKGTDKLLTVPDWLKERWKEHKEKDSINVSSNLAVSKQNYQ